MTNREKYKKAFSAVYPSDKFSWEAEKMKKIRKQHIYKTMAASIAGCIIFMGSVTAAYAMDVGGIQRTIQLWIQGDCTNATIEFNGDGTYDIEYTDNEGNTGHRSGGGVAIEADGSERPVSEEEIMEELTMPEVEYKEDGSVWVYWFDQKFDITDKFEDGICYVKLVKGEETLYMTIKYQDGYTVHPNKYASPDKW